MSFYLRSSETPSYGLFQLKIPPQLGQSVMSNLRKALLMGSLAQGTAIAELAEKFQACAPQLSASYFLTNSGSLASGGATLVFDVELLDIVNRKASKEEL